MRYTLYFTILIIGLTIANTLVPAEIKESAAQRACRIHDLMLSAVDKKDVSLVKEVLAQGADINVALREAAQTNTLNIVQFALDNGADINSKVSGGYTALMLAAGKGFNSIVQLLIDRGADVNKQNSLGDTALIEAARKGHTNTVKILLDHGANLDKQDYYRYTALMWAAEQGDTNTVKLLLDYGAKTRFRGYNKSLAPTRKTALELAQAHGHEEIVKLLTPYERTSKRHAKKKIKEAAKKSF